MIVNDPDAYKARCVEHADDAIDGITESFFTKVRDAMTELGIPDVFMVVEVRGTENKRWPLVGHLGAQALAPELSALGYGYCTKKAQRAVADAVERGAKSAGGSK